MTIERFPPGKVPWDVVAEKVRADLPPEVVLGPACGEDAALVKIGGEVWAVATDPITFTSRDAGRLAVIINANDVAVRGARPLFFTAVVLVAPEEAERVRVADLLEQVRSTCAALGVSLIGGHTEVTPGIPRTLVVGTMLGRVTGRPFTTGGLREGDRIGLTKWAALEGTSILLSEFGGQARKAVGAAALAAAERILAEDWISVVPEAAIAAGLPGVTALHDVTEGGVGEALHEMARASGRDLSITSDSIPVLEATRALAAVLDVDPLGVIGSGALLVGCAPGAAPDLERAYASAGIPFAWIGTCGAPSGSPGASVPRFPRDEILKAWLFEGIDAVLFDMDGTLVDSRYDWEHIRSVLDIRGHSILDEIDALPGPERETKLALLDDFEREASLAARPKDGAKELVDLVRTRGFKTALVTNNSAANVGLLLDRFQLEFDTVITRDSGLFKPSPAPLIEAMRRLEVDPGRCVFVGDYLFDVEAGKRAGCAKVGILYDDENRFSAGADFTFPDVRTLRAYLEFVTGKG